MTGKTAKGSALRVAQSLEAHSLLAIVFGGLIYILAVTGTLAVFNHDLQRWEQPHVPEMTSISPQAAQAAALAVFESEETPSTHLYINFPQDDLPRTVITTDTQAFFAAEDGTIATGEAFPWTQFLLDLHYYLHLPQILGLTIVGALGAMLIGLSFSGILAHPRIFRDAFTFRRSAGRLTHVDLHNRLSVWTLPFHFSNALTGSILGLASILAFAIAAAGFSNDVEAVFEPVFGTEPAPVEGKAAVADIAGPLSYMEQNFPDHRPSYFILHDPGTAGQHSTIIAEHSDRLIFGEYYNFTASGEYEGNVGISDGTIGQQVTGAVYNIHFGHWGGLPVKLAYLLFGLGLCVIVASGLSIYFAKREANGRPAPKLAAVWSGVIWGTPAMLAITLLAAFLGGEGGVLVAIFWLGLGAGLIASSFSNARDVKLTGQFGTAGALAAVLVIYFARYGSDALSQAGLAVTLTGIALLVGCIAWATWSARQGSDDGDIMRAKDLEPAE
ncbi:MAG: PepSY domain-containing protein [Erythrobacter sp.]|nr:PepSY domain-containing protein [Erythrobacter sp.]